jgi:two-component system copper resistance phosphate regulon response regulator CusR
VRVLVAEDDQGLRSVLVRGLQENDYVVDAVANGEEALKFLRSYSYELAVLDWRMPGISGLDVVRWMRRNAHAARILMLTARDQPADRVTGLDAGADDYLVKPFDFSELLARMRALQRRPSAVQQPEIVIGDLRFDPATRRVLVAGRPAVLTATEFSILELLVRKSPAVVPRRSIALNVWEDEADAMGSNTIDVHLARLRAKLAGGRVRIETVRGVGYRLVGL